MAYCTNCGEELTEDVKFCPECGSAINPDEAIEKTSDGGFRTDTGTVHQSASEQINERVGDTNVVGRRVGAVIIDWFPVGVLVIIVGIILGIQSTFGTLFVGFIVTMGYYIVLEGMYGQTAGKRLLGIEVRTTNDRAPTMQDAIVRNLLRVVDGFFNYLVGLFAILLSSNNQRIGDKVAGTVVIRTDSSRR